MHSAVRIMIIVACAAAIAHSQSLTGSKSTSHMTTATSNITVPPKAKVETVVDDYHGHKISDPYRWLENAKSPETQKFVAEQNAYTQQMLEAVPGRDKLRARIEQLLTIGRVEAPSPEGKYYFYEKREGHQNQPVVYVREGLQGQDRALIDVNSLAPDGTVALDWWYPSHNGQYVAYGTSPNGSEISTLHVIETDSGRLLPEHIERTRAANVAWLPDNSGFYYTRYPRPGDVPAGQELYNRHVFFHKLAGPDYSDGLKDPLIFGEGLDPQYWPFVHLSDDGKWLLVGVSEGWTKSELFVKDVSKPDSKFVPITSGKNFLYSAGILHGDIYITTNEDAPRYRVFKVPAANPDRSQWKEVIPQTDAVIDGSALIIAGRLFVPYVKNASAALSIYSLEGRHIADVAMPTLGSFLNQLGGDWDSKEAFFAFHSYATPPVAYRVTPDGKTSEFVRVTSDVDPTQYEVRQEWFNSKDGTRVPMFIVHKKGLALNGKNPTVLSGYGGFNLARTPFFDRNAMLVLLEHGGIYADVQLRGGNEFGEEWHRAGMLDKKQNVFDDFISAAEHLIARKYTDKEHLAIQGGSNGGLLMGAALTQRPDLFRAVVCQVPLLDMLRYQNFQIARLWIPEYGSAEDPKQFDFIYAYSPYQHVKPGTVYPATLFMTADTDTRVDPMHAKKMTALLQAQAANGPDRPILLRVDTKAGHGVGKPIGKLLEDDVDLWAFVFQQLGIGNDSGNLESVLNQMDKSAATFKSAEADLQADQYQKVVDETDVQKGKIYFRRRDSEMDLALRIASPATKEIVLTKGRGRLYEPGIDQVTERNLGEKSEFEAFLSLGFGSRGHDLTKDYEVKLAGWETVDGARTARLDLVPNSQKIRNIYSRIVLWVDPVRDVLLKQQFFEPSGDYRLAHYTNIRVNERLSDDVFKLNTGPNTRTVNAQ